MMRVQSLLLFSLLITSFCVHRLIVVATGWERSGREESKEDTATLLLSLATSSPHHRPLMTSSSTFLSPSSTQSPMSLSTGSSDRRHHRRWKDPHRQRHESPPASTAHRRHSTVTPALPLWQLPPPISPTSQMNYDEERSGDANSSSSAMPTSEVSPAMTESPRNAACPITPNHTDEGFHQESPSNVFLTQCSLGDSSQHKCQSWAINVVIALRPETPKKYLDDISDFLGQITIGCYNSTTVSIFTPTQLNEKCNKSSAGDSDNPIMSRIKLADVVIPKNHDIFFTIKRLFTIQNECSSREKTATGGLILLFTNSPYTDFCPYKSIPPIHMTWLTRIYYSGDDWGPDDTNPRAMFNFVNCTPEDCEFVRYEGGKLKDMASETRTCTYEEGGGDNTVWIVVFAIICLTMTVIALGCTYFCYRKANIRWRKFFLREQLQKQKYTMEEIKAMGGCSPPVTVKGKPSMKKTNATNANDYSDHKTEAEFTETDPWEIAASNLLILENKVLGHGAFATVYKAVLNGRVPLLDINPTLKLDLCPDTEQHECEVAVKRLPPHADLLSRKDFLQEMAFMKSIGYHRHITSLLGCVSRSHESFLVVEFCHHGDLLNFLRAQNKHVLIGENDECPVDADVCLRVKDLVSIAWQISDGMSYLSSLNFIHRDLAARNVLLTKSLVAKISDFGLGRHVDSSLYMAKGGRLPIKWMPPEALKYNEFSQKSDVWSFGVLLYEVFSLGKSPFPTVQPFEMIEHLEAGGRLPLTLLCPQQIYSIMSACGELMAEDRPTFEDIKKSLTTLLNTNDEHYGYIELERDGMGIAKANDLHLFIEGVPENVGEQVMEIIATGEGIVDANDEVDWMYLHDDGSERKSGRSRSASDGQKSVERLCLATSPLQKSHSTSFFERRTTKSSVQRADGGEEERSENVHESKHSIGKRVFSNSIGSLC